MIIRKKFEFLDFKGYKVQELRKYVLEKQNKLAINLRNRNRKTVLNYIRRLLEDERCIAYAIFLCLKTYLSNLLSTIYFSNDIYYKLVNKIYSIVKDPNSYSVYADFQYTYFPKLNSNKRFVSTLSILDKSLQYLYLFVMEVIYEELSDFNCFSFRRFRHTGWAVKAVVLVLLSYTRFDLPNHVLEIRIRRFNIFVWCQWVFENILNFKFEKDFSIYILPRNIFRKWLGYCSLFYSNSQMGKLSDNQSGIEEFRGFNVIF